MIEYKNLYWMLDYYYKKNDIKDLVMWFCLKMDELIESHGLAIYNNSANTLDSIISYIKPIAKEWITPCLGSSSNDIKMFELSTTIFVSFKDKHDAFLELVSLYCESKFDMTTK